MPSTFNGLVEHYRPIVAGNVRAAAEDLRAKYRELVSVAYPPASAPGEPPHRRTGMLQDSIEVVGPASQGDLILASVGTPVPYGLWLELGTSRMAARPWLSRGLADNEPSIQERIASGFSAGELAA